MTNFRKTAVTFVLRPYLFLKDSIATLARILRSTQPSAPRTYSVGSDGSIRTLRPLTGIVQVATNEVPRLILPEWAFPYDKNDFSIEALYYRAIGRITRHSRKILLSCLRRRRGRILRCSYISSCGQSGTSPDSY